MEAQPSLRQEAEAKSRGYFYSVNLLIILLFQLLKRTNRQHVTRVSISMLLIRTSFLGAAVKCFISFLLHLQSKRADKRVEQEGEPER